MTAARTGRLDRALAQAPAFAVAGLLQGALLVYLLLTQVPARVVPLGHRLAAAAAIGCLVAIEVALAAWLNAAVELFGGRYRRAGWLVDPLKAAGLAALLGLSAASVVKLTATGVHLKRSDLWFAWHSRRQLLDEAVATETRALVLFGGATLAAGCLLLALLWRLRRRPAGPATLAALLALPVVAVPLGLSLYRASPTVERFVTRLSPEGHWLASRAGHRFRPAATASASGAHLGSPITAYRPAAPAAPANLVLILLESVPWKRTPFGGGPAGMMPNLERLAQESVLFERAYTTSTHSDYAQMAALSSLHPRKYDRHDYYARIEYPRTLAWDAFAAAGYATAMFSCQNERWGNMLGYLDTPGLDLLRHSLDWPRARHRGRGPESKVYEETPVAAWRAWRSSAPRPWLSYLNFQANHFPYEIPPEAPRPFSPWRLDFPASYFAYPTDKVPVMLNRFYNALAYSDRWIGEVRAELERAGEWQRTAVVVASDHGEAFYEHGYPTHGPDLHEEQVRSLLLVRLPGVAARRVDEPVSLLDLLPAVLAGLGLPPHGNLQGRGDILEPDYSAAGRPLFFTIQGMTSMDGVLRDGWKLLVDWESGRRRLFHLPGDPDELSDRSATEAAHAAELERLLESFLERQLAYYAERGWEQGHYPPPLP